MNEHISNQACPNKFCPNFGVFNEEEIAIHDKNFNRLRCRKCGKTWSGHSKEFRYGLRSKELQINRAIEMIKAKIPIRKIAGFVNVSPGTVMRWKKKLKNK
ncbi:IS1 family transposase [Candidatus Peregrinibacteria bacterium]|nr:IS1 family transposase [Candidatus Peregrinibacteria bacterium]